MIGWERKRTRDAEFEKERVEFEKSIEHLSDHEKMIACFIRPLTKTLDYKSLAQKILKIEPISVEEIVKIK